MADIDIRLQEGTATARLNGIATPVQDTDAANRAFVLTNRGRTLESLVEIPLTVAANSGLGWSGSADGIVTHSDIDDHVLVFLNGVLLTAPDDYTASMGALTLTTRVRSAILDSNNWCLELLIQPGSQTGGSGGVGPTGTFTPTFGLGDIIRTAAPATVATLTGLTATTAGVFTFASEANLDTFLQELAVHRPSNGQPFESTRTVVIQVGTTVIGGIPVGAQVTVARPLTATITGITLTRALTTADSVLFVAPNRNNTIVRSITTIPASQRSVSGTTISVTIPSSDTDRFAAAGTIQLIGADRTQVILINREFGNAVYTVSNYVATPTQITYDLNQVVAVDFAGRTQVPFTIPTRDLEAYYCGVENTNRRFEHLVDTPDTYIGARGQQLRVNSTETGLEFFPSEFAVDVVRISGTTSSFSNNAANIINGDYILQPNTNKYLNGAGDAVVTLGNDAGSYFWYNEFRNVSLVATGVVGTSENWRVVAGHWINDAVYAEGYVVQNPTPATIAPAGRFVVVAFGGLIFPTTIADLQVPSGALVAGIVGGTSPQAEVLSGFDPDRIDTHFLNRPLIEAENAFTVRTDLVGTVQSFVFTESGHLRLPNATPGNANDAVTMSYVDSQGGSNIVNRRTPTGAITFTQAEIDALDGTTTTVTRTVMVGADVVATATVTATANQNLSFDYTVTLDTLVTGWTFVDATQSGTDLPFTLVIGMDHEWTASFNSSQVSGDLVINVANTSVETGIFYAEGDIDVRLDHLPPTTGFVEALGFQTEEDAAETFQQLSPNDPYVVTSDLSAYVRGSDVQIEVTRADTFPTLPNDGDEHYLTSDIYPAGTTFNQAPTPVPVSFAGTGNQAQRTLTVIDPRSQETIPAGTIFVNQQNVPLITSSRIILAGGAGRNFRRGFVRDRSFNGIHATRSSTIGTTVVSTNVSEVQYRDITTVAPTGTNPPRLTLVDATLHDFHYQQSVLSPGGSSVVRNLHYIVIRTPTGDINNYPTQATAIDVIEAAIQDSSALPIDLIQGSATPVDFTTTARFQSGSYDVMGDLGSTREETTYRFLPLNDFTITTSNINNLPITPDSAGNIDIVQNDDVRAWNVTFSRDFLGVPTTPTAATFTPGPYVYQNDAWNKLDYAGTTGGSDTSSLDVRTDNLNLFVPTQTIANGFGNLPASSGTASWIHTIQINGVNALTINATAVTHAADADYEFNYTALGDWSLVGDARVTTSRGLTYNGPDLIVPVRGPNSVYATDARIEIFKQIVSASTSFNDFRTNIANL